jgi:CubicO group peptidase (beta-lactamase class C family)
LAALLTLGAASAGADAVDDFVRSQMERQKIPGLALAVCRDGRLVKAQGYGLANVEHQVPVKPETIFQSGSLGKQFTATAVMMLVEAGKLALDDPITRYFDAAPAGWRDITVRHLLTHTSGIKDWEGEKDIDYRRDYSEEQLAKVAMGLPPDFRPGTQWSYSNTGYVLLGILIHKVSGQFYGDFLHDRVFEPLGMTTARVINEADIVPNRAAGYQLVEDKLKNQDWVAPSVNTTADGSLYLTVLDLAKWDAGLRADRLLGPGGLQQMWTPVRLANGSSYPYGFGWGIDEQRGRRLIEHGGSWQGFRAAINRYVESGLTVIALANLAQAQPEAIASGVAGVLEASLALPDPREPRPDPDPARTAALRDVLAAWAKGEPSARMAKGLRDTHAGSERENSSRRRTGERLEQSKALSFLAEDVVSGRGLERRGEAVARIVHCGLVTPKAAYAYRFYLNARGEVADFSWDER